MRFVIAGLGSIGRRHLRNLLALGERDIILYRSHRSTLPDAELDGFPEETDLGAALDHKPDAVIVSNPTALHMDVALPAARAGCALLLEKPIAHNLDEGMQESLSALRQVVTAQRAPVLVGFQFRFHPGLHQVKQLLQDGAIGRPLSVRAHWGEYLPGWHPWEDYRQGYSARADLGGGVVLTLSHPLDYLRWLLGEAQVAWAVTDRLGDLELDVEDTAEIGLRFTSQSGCLGSVHLDFNQRPPAHWLEISGTQGSLRWNNADGCAHLYRCRGGSQTRPYETRPDGEWEVFALPDGFERNYLFLAEMQHFREVVRGAAQPLCTLEDGVRALELAMEIIGRGSPTKNEDPGKE